MWSAQVEQNLCQRDFGPLFEREPLHLLPKFWAKDGAAVFILIRSVQKLGNASFLGTPRLSPVLPGFSASGWWKSGAATSSPSTGPKVVPGAKRGETGDGVGLPELCTEVMAGVLCDFTESQEPPGF